MATRSYIGKRFEDNKIHYIYCHWDGYPSHNGVLLTDYYSTDDKVTELINLGDLSCLEPNIDKCVRYDGNIRVGDLEHFLDGEVSYLYLFENGEWVCYDYKGDYVNL